MHENLKPGVYIQAGNEVTPLKNFGVLEGLLGNSDRPQDVAALVPYVYAAISRRKARIVEIEYEWTKGEQISTMPPIQFRMKSMLKRTDEALQLLGSAYWYKLRTGSGALAGFRWLDPRSITPDENSIENPYGFMNYKRTTMSGVLDIPSDDLLVFREEGLAEYKASSIAGVATRLATEVLYSISTAEKATYDNPLPVSLVIVPMATSKEDKADLKAYISRIFNRHTKTDAMHRVAPVYEGTSIERISMTPEELSFNEARTPNAEAVVSAHGVPMHELFGDASNMATADNATKSFIRRIGSRLDEIAEIINYDEEMQSLGWDLSFYPERHSEMQKDENETSQAFTNYLQGFTTEAAAYLVGINAEDFPEGMEIFPTEPEPKEESEEKEPEVIAPVIVEKAMNEDLRRWRRKAKRKRVAEFSSDLIPAEMAVKIKAEIAAGGKIDDIFNKYIAMPDEAKGELESILEDAIKTLALQPEQPTININLADER